MTGETRKALIGYSLFDFGNSAFTLIFHAYLFPLYLKDVVFSGNSQGSVVWGAILSSSALFAAAVGPFVGRAADYFGKWRVFAVVAGFSFVTAGISASSIGGNTKLVIITFFAASACFYLAANLYDSLLGQIATVNSRPTFSGFAWGFGYLGGVLCFLGVYKFQAWFGIASPKPYLFTALFYGLFGVLSLGILKKPVENRPRLRARVSFEQMLAGLTAERIGLLIGYLLIADVIGAIVAFTAIYASNELHLGASAIGGFLLAVQILAFPFTYLVSLVAVKTGVAAVLKFCAIVWAAILILFVVRVSVFGMWIVVVMTSLVIGSTQALLRSQYSDLVLERRESEQFGWYGIATESATIIAPIFFVISAFLFGSQRYAMGVMLIPLTLGFLLVFRYSRRLENRSVTGC